MYSPEIAAQLRRRGHNVVHATELDLAGTSDAEVFAAMAAEGRAIVTNNADDYTLLFSRAAGEGLEHSGVFLTSDRSMPRSRAGIGLFVRVLEDVLEGSPSDDAYRNQLRWLP